MDCARCGRTAGESDRFCAACGASLVAPSLPGAEPGDEASLAAVPAPERTAERIAAAVMPAAELPPTDAGEDAGVGAAATAHAAPAAFVYGGFWRRFVALWVDALVLFFPQAVMRVALGLPALSYDDEWGDPTVLTAECLGVAMTIVYAAALESSLGQGSLGQQVLGLRVTDLQGRRIGFARALARQFAKLLSMLLCGFGYVLQLWNGRRQTLHDMICGVVVLRTDEAPAREPSRMAVMS
ncbi:MAG: RDD family protein [Candidatus Eisenbacteria bacterium]